MSTTKIILEFNDGDPTLVNIYRYIEYMETLNNTLPEDMRDKRPMDLELGIRCLINEGLTAFEYRMGGKEDV